MRKQKRRNPNLLSARHQGDRLDRELIRTELAPLAEEPEIMLRLEALLSEETRYGSSYA